ncbi:MAG: thioredoxin family protein [Dehalococcoidia bacterium]|nr:thioredoxin family protein [Dehalococcoidia bacterium]
MASVVTQERFSKGFTYPEYIAQIAVNKDMFERFYASAQLTPDDTAFFRRAAPAGAKKMLVLGEDWCPDVYRGLPVFVRIAEAAGLELRIFPRDKHPDIMNEFLNRGEFMSIPVVVFYTGDLKYLCHWIERPASASTDRARLEETVKKEMPGAGEQELRTALRQRMQALQPAWQKETVRELRQLLADKLGIR